MSSSGIKNDKFSNMTKDNKQQKLSDSIEPAIAYSTCYRQYGINVLSLFDGMSCGQIALNKVGIEYENYFASEIDEKAIYITQKNYPNTKQIGSITEVKGSDLPKIDLLFGGSPCQSFSSFGNGKGFDGKSGLFWEFVRVLNEVKPTHFLLENVVMKKEWEDIITEALGVKPIKINSSLFSAQNRPRIYWTNIPINELPKENKTAVNDILETPNFHNNYPKWLLGKFGNKTRLEQLWYADGKASCLTSNVHKGQKSTFTKDRKENIHRLTVVECERLQTVPDNYTEGVSNTDRYKMLGNGWTVDVIAHIFGGLS